MPYLILGIGSLALSALSLTKDLFKEVDNSGDETSSIILNATLFIVAGAGIYLIATNKLKFNVK